MNMAPRVGVTNPAIIINVVVLPDPLGPNIVQNSPPDIERSIPATATVSL
jgi:hypothetical protein